MAEIVHQSDHLLIVNAGEVLSIVIVSNIFIDSAMSVVISVLYAKIGIVSNISIQSELSMVTSVSVCQFKYSQ